MSSFALKALACGALITLLGTPRAGAQAGVTRQTVAPAPTELRAIERAPGRYGHPVLITGQIVGGALAAAGAGFAAWAMYENPYGPDRRVKGDEGYTPNANTAYALGSFAGATAATFLIGRIDKSKSNLLGAALGAAIPTIPLLFGRHEPYLPLIGIVLAAPAQAIGATLGDQLSRR